MLKKTVLFTMLLFFILTVNLYAVNNQPSIDSILTKEIERHPKSTPRDIYKFLYQAAFGSAHAVNDTSMVKNWMKREIAGMDYSVHDELIDTLSPEGSIVRVNLRPYIKKGYDTEILLDAFIKTANNHKGAMNTFQEYWEAAEKLTVLGKFQFGLSELNNFYEKMKAENFPAVHHSETYKKAYKPAYRVIDTRFLSIEDK